MNQKLRLFPWVTGLFVVGVFSLVIGTIVDKTIGRKEYPQSTKEFAIEAIHSVVFEGVSDVTIIQGDTEKLIAKGTTRALEDIIIKTSDGKLTLSQKSRFHISLFSIGKTESTQYEYTLYVKDLKHIENKGVGSVIADNFKTENLSIINKGVGSMEFDNITATRVSIFLEGVGSLTVSGAAKKLDGSIDGIGSFEGYSLKTNECDLTLRGLGSAEVYCTDFLKGTVLGVGSIDYKGNPLKIEKDIKGLGTISN